MALEDCIRKAGKALDRDDADAIQSLIDQGVSEQDAVAQHLAAIDAELKDVTDRAVAAGGKVVQPEQNDATETNRAGETGVAGLPAQPDAASQGREPDGSLAGLPRVNGASVFQKAVEVAKRYMAAVGLPYRPPSNFAKVNVERAGRIAQAFTDMKHEPNDPVVKAAYQAMIDETAAQYQAIVDSGLVVEFITGEDPYHGNPREMTEDVRNNNHMWVFPTDNGFGSNAAFDVADNPLLAETEFQISGRTARANDLFRVVHDYFGHVKEGVGFRAFGEENAWRAHAAMYSPLARRAMTTETRGQNSWVNYGPHGEHNGTATPETTIYADQKIGLLPEWVGEQGRVLNQSQVPAQAKPRAQRNSEGFYSAVEQTVIDLQIPAWKIRPESNLTPDEQARLEQLKGVEITSSNPARTAENVEVITLRDVEQPDGSKLPDEYMVRDAASERGYFPHTYKTREQADAHADRVRKGLEDQAELLRLQQKIASGKNGSVDGTELWNKISKTPGVKKEELDVLGLEDYLKSGDRFTRDTVIDFIREGGIKIETIVADKEQSESSGEFDWDETTDDDSSNWEGMSDDDIYQVKKDRADDVGWDWDRWIEDHIEELTSKFELTDAQVEELEGVGRRGSEDTLRGFEQFDFDKLYDLAEDDVQEWAEDRARDSYMDNPVTIYKDSDTTISIIGNSDQGYEVYHADSHTAIAEFGEVYSFREAEIRARDYAYENGLWTSSDDSTVAKWSEYVTKGKHKNYREYKMTLPDNPGTPFEYDTHFPDPNIVAFLRVTDRLLSLPSSRKNQGDAPDDYKGKYQTTIGSYRDLIETIDNQHDDAWVKEQGFSFAYQRRPERFFTDNQWKDAVQERIDEMNAAWQQDSQSDAKATFFVDEFQSDWHQQGRKLGYRKGLTDAEMDELGEHIERTRQLGIDHFDELLPIRFKQELARIYTSSVTDMSFRSMVVLSNETRDEYKTAQKEYFKTLRSDPEGAPMFELLKTYQGLQARRDAETRGVTDAPFKDEAWLGLGLKKALMEAARGGFESFAWADSNVLSDRWSERYRELYENQYDLKMPSLIKKLTGETPVHLTLDGDPWVEPMSDESYKAQREDLKNQEAQLYLDIEALPGYPTDGTPAEQASFTRESPQGSEILRRAQLLRTQQANLATDASAPELGMWVIPLTDKFVSKAKNEGFPLFQQARGSIRLFDNKRVIKLGEASDLSTFLHETGHLFLDLEAQLAAEFGVTDRQQKILDWLGVASFDDITVEHHEKWAETFEAYLREGKAPSVGLRDAFASFARWLTRIYESLSSLTRAKLDPTITDIFDRLLATQQELDRAAGSPIYDQFFRSKEQAGMSDAQWEKYQEQRAKVKTAAQTTVQGKALEQYRKMREKEWDDERRPLVEEAREELAKEPRYQLLSDLADHPMDYDVVLEALGVTKVPGRLIGKIKKGGIDPAEYAELYGYPSIKAMLDDVIDSPTLRQAAEAQGQAQMIERHGDVLNDGTLEREVQEAMHNDEEAKLLSMEITALDRKAPEIDREYLKAEAKRVIAGMKFKEILPARYYQAEIKAAQRAATATTAAERRAFKIQQLANHYLYREAIDVKAAMDKQRAYIERVKTRAYNTREVREDYVQNMKLLANLYDFRKGKQQRVIEIDTLLNWFETQVNDPNQFAQLQLLDETLLRALAAKQAGTLASYPIPTFDDFTADEVRGLYEMLRHMRFVGGVMSDASKAEFNVEKQALTDSIVEHGGRDLRDPNQVIRTPTKLDRWLDAAKDMGFGLVSLRNMVHKLDGTFDSKTNERGAAHGTIFAPLEEAMNAKTKMHEKLYEAYVQLMRGISHIGLVRNEKTITTDTGKQWTTSAEERFMLALYWGTESSREAILEGHGVSEADVMRMMSLLTPEQLKLVNAVWKVNETLWPDLSAAATVMFGVAPPKLEAVLFTVNGVQMTGGHMRLYYNDIADELKEEQDKGKNMMAMMPSRAGSTIARIGSGGKPVLLSRDNITRAYADSVHFIAFAQPVRRLAGMINSGDVKGAIARKHGNAFFKSLVKTVDGITSNRKAQDEVEFIAKLSRHFRKAATMKALAYSLRNALEGLGSIAIVREEIGTGPMISGMLRVLTSPVETFKFVNEQSVQMRERAALVNRESNEYLKHISLGGPVAGAWNIFVQAGFTPQRVIDGLISYPAWIAKYEQVLKASDDIDLARSEADRVVATAVGSGSDLELGNLFQSNRSELLRTFTTFGSWFNIYFNRIYKASKGFSGDGILSVNMLQAAVVTPLLVSLIGAFAKMDFPADDEDFEKWLAKRYGSFLLGTIPLVRDFSALLTGYAPKTPIASGEQSLVNLFREMRQTVSGEQEGVKAVSDYVKVAATLMPIPGAGNVTKFLDYTESYNQGNEGDTFNPLKAVLAGPTRK